MIPLMDDIAVSGATPAGVYTYYVYSSFNPSPLLFNVSDQAGGDADLFVSTVNPFPSQGSANYSSTVCCGGDELISVANNPGNAVYFVAVLAWEGDVTYQITAGPAAKN